MRWSSNEVVDEELLQQKKHLMGVLLMEKQPSPLKDFSDLQQSIESIHPTAKKKEKKRKPRMLTHQNLKSREKRDATVSDSEPSPQVMSGA